MHHLHIIHTIGATPIVRLNNLSPNSDVHLYAKLEGWNPTGSIKDRIVRHMISALPATYTSGMSHRRVALAAACICLLSVSFLTSCGADDAPIVSATLTDATITLEPNRTPAGRTTFIVSNEGDVIHEFAILRTDLPPAELPLRDENWVDESGPGVELVAEIEHALPGRERELEADLSPGSYVIISNVERDYLLGMYAPLTVE